MPGVPSPSLCFSLSRRLSLLRPDLMPCPAGTLYHLVTPPFWRLIQWPMWTSTISLLIIVSTGISTLWFRMTVILIWSYPRNFWIYIQTALNSIMGLEAVSTQIICTWTFLSVCRTIVACLKRRWWLFAGSPNGSHFICISIFSDSQAAIISLSDFVNNSRIVRECRRCFDFLSGRFTSVSLVWVPGHFTILGNCRAGELAKAVAIFSESSSIELDVPHASVKLSIARKFFRDANLSWVNEESCTSPRFTCPCWIEGVPTN